MKNIKNTKKNNKKNFNMLRFIFPNNKSIFLFIVIFIFSFFILNYFFSKKLQEQSYTLLNFDIEKKYLFTNHLYLASKIDTDIEKIKTNFFFLDKLAENYSSTISEDYLKFSETRFSNSSLDTLIFIVQKELSFNKSCKNVFSNIVKLPINEYQFEINLKYKGIKKIAYVSLINGIDAKDISSIKSILNSCEILFFEIIEKNFYKIYIDQLKQSLFLNKYLLKNVFDSQNTQTLKTEVKTEEAIKILEIFEKKYKSNIKIINYALNNLYNYKLEKVQNQILENYDSYKSINFEKNIIFIIISIMIGISFNLLIDLIIKINSYKKKLHFD